MIARLLLMPGVKVVEESEGWKSREGNIVHPGGSCMALSYMRELNTGRYQNRLGQQSMPSAIQAKSFDICDLRTW